MEDWFWQLSRYIIGLVLLSFKLSQLVKTGLSMRTSFYQKPNLDRRQITSRYGFNFFYRFAQYQTKCKLCGDYVTQKDCHYCQRIIV